MLSELLKLSILLRTHQLGPISFVIFCWIILVISTWYPSYSCRKSATLTIDIGRRRLTRRLLLSPYSERRGGGQADATGKHQMKVDDDPPTIERYCAEKDAWRKFLATGEESKRVEAVAQDTKEWDIRLREL